MLAAPLVMPSVFSGQPPEGVSLRFSVEGYLFAQPLPSPATPSPNAVYVPGVGVRLENTLTGKTAETRRTDLSGRFAFFGQDPGKYRVCWEAAGFVSGCSESLSVSDNVNLAPLPLQVRRGPRLMLLYGRVRFADRSLPRALDPLAGVNALAVVRARGARGRLLVPQAYVSNSGSYLLPAIPVRGAVTIEAAIEGAVARRRFSRVKPRERAQRVDLTFTNQPPESGGIVATAPGGKHWTVQPGETVQLRARASDLDGDALTYRWIPAAGVAEAKPPKGNQTAYRMPESPGEFEFAVVIGDRRGGYARDVITISTGRMRFAGSIAGTDAPALSGADVEVNGKHATADETGRFELLVPEAPRYVLNIRRRGYGLVSHIYDVGMTGGRWTMTRASVTPADPAEPIDAANERQPSDCPGSPTEQARRGGKAKHAACGPGIRVRIPPGALVDGNGDSPDGPVDVALTTADLRAPDALPGDRTTIRANGSRAALASFGAGSVEITRNRVRYQLAPGRRAELIIPIASNKTSPPVVQLLRYNEKNGRWVRMGTARRAGRTYRGTVSHLSAFSASVLPPGPACVRLETTLMPQLFELQTVYPFSVVFHGHVFSVEVSESFIVSDNGRQRFHVLYNLPLNTAVRISAFQIGAFTPGTNPVPSAIPLVVPGSTPGTVSSANQIEVNTGSVPQNPAAPNPPAFPYQACRNAVELSPAIAAGAPPDPLRNTFFYGLYSFAAVNLDELDQGDAKVFKDQTAAYYKTIDPLGKRLTLEDFKRINRFSAGEFVAQYANSGDLGFGRDMHCRSEVGTDPFQLFKPISCYVTNYGDRFTDDTRDAIDAAIAYAEEAAGVPPGQRTRKPVATVAMEFSPIANGPPDPIVKFYVYDAAGRRTDAANLDGFGARPVPAVCMACHGGKYPKVAGDRSQPVFDPNDPFTADLDARFIPFDLRSFTLPVADIPGAGVVDFKADQQQTFKDLNQQIVAESLLRRAHVGPFPTLVTVNVPQALEVLQKMYAGGSSTQVENVITSGWLSTSPLPLSAGPVLYDRLVSRSCRSCHLSLAPRSDVPSISWERADDFVSRIVQIEQLVCRTHKMPHAIATHNRFWLSTNPHQPTLLNDISALLGRPRAC